jgi:predicted DNA-binding protein YlxM (UPF0122 family)
VWPADRRQVRISAALAMPFVPFASSEKYAGVVETWTPAGFWLSRTSGPPHEPLVRVGSHVGRRSSPCGRRRPSRLAEERRAPERVARKLERWYVDDHLSVAEIARRLGRSDHWVRTMLIRAEIPFRRRSLPPVSDLARLYIEDKLSTREIAARFGVSQAKVWRDLRDGGVPRRASRGGRAPLASSPRQPAGAVRRLMSGRGTRPCGPEGSATAIIR